MMEKAIRWIYFKGLTTRISIYYILVFIFYAGTLLVGPGRSAMVFFCLMLGLILMGSFYSFRPFNKNWSPMKMAITKLTHVMALGILLFSALYNFFLIHGQLIGGEVTWGQRIASVVIIAGGIILSAIILGQKKFEPRYEQV